MSDAGTPLICDPGSVLLKTLYENGIEVTSLPGACAIPTFLSQVPRDDEGFVFVGFFPKTAQKSEEILTEYSKSNLVFYESPNRLLDTLELIKKVRGNVKAAVGRELSKMFEEVVTGTVEELLTHFKSGLKGEIVCMVYPSDAESEIDVVAKIKLLKSKGFSSKDISNILSALYGLNKNDVYKLTMS